ncbi:hypothetical protein Hanom_Chr07g00594651 [Helianthus anomalus]
MHLRIIIVIFVCMAVFSVGIRHCNLNLLQKIIKLYLEPYYGIVFYDNSLTMVTETISG